MARTIDVHTKRAQKAEKGLAGRGLLGIRVKLAKKDRAQRSKKEREFFIDNLLVRIHLIIEMVLVDRPCAMGV